MFLGDKGKPTKFHTIRLNYDIIIDNEKLTLHKLITKLGFYTVNFDTKLKEVEIVYDTDNKLLTGVGLILRKKITPSRVYFSLVRVNNLSKSVQLREKKSFLGECELKDEPRDFPTQIADEINNVFNNLFTINLVDIVKHSSQYIRMDVRGNRYKIVSGRGYEIEASFEDIKVRDVRTGRKAITKIFSLKMEDDPNFEKERQHVLLIIEKYCKELVPIQRTRFEIAEVAVRQRVNQPSSTEKQKGKKKKKELRTEEGF